MVLGKKHAITVLTPVLLFGKENNVFDLKEYKRKYYQEHKEHLKELHKIWCENNREHFREQQKQYCKDNPEQTRKTKKRYRETHVDEMKKYAKKYRETHAKEISEKRKAMKEYLAKHSKLYRAENREKIRENKRQYYLKNKEKISKRAREFEIVKRRESPKYNLNKKIGLLMRVALKGNKAGRHWETLVDYTLKDLINHLKKTMPEGYDWQDYLGGKLHIDHIIPKSVFNYTKPEHVDFKRCWALDNLQLLPAEENRNKYNKLSRPFQPALQF